MFKLRHKCQANVAQCSGITSSSSSANKLAPTRYARGCARRYANGPISAFHQRLETADTLVYVDLPYIKSYWFVTKRLLKGLFVKPEGWPAGSSILKGTFESYNVLRHCPKFWNDDFTVRLEALSDRKSLYIIKSVSELDHFVSRNIK